MDATIARVRRAIDFIEANLFGRLSLVEVAAASGLSVHHLHRLFTAIFGHSIKAYVRKRRLTEAAAMLRTTRRGVLEVALQCQFESQASFTRAFRALFGEPPGRYRRGAARGWYPGVPAATVASLEHLRNDGVSRAPARRKLEHAVLVEGLALPIDLDAELRIVEQWARLRASLDPCVRRAIAYGVALPAHPAVPLGKEDSLVYLVGIGAGQGAAFTAPPPHRCIVPPGDYAVFEHRGSAEQMTATLDYIWATWLPRSGLEKSRRPDFERVHLGEPGPAIEIWLSVEA